MWPSWWDRPRVLRHSGVAQCSQKAMRFWACFSTGVVMSTMARSSGPRIEEVFSHLGYSQPSAEKLNSCMRPTEPEASAWLSLEATRSESTKSSVRAGSSPPGLKEMVKNT